MFDGKKKKKTCLFARVNHNSAAMKNKLKFECHRVLFVSSKQNITGLKNVITFEATRDRKFIEAKVNKD